MWLPSDLLRQLGEIHEGHQQLFQQCRNSTTVLNNSGSLGLQTGANTLAGYTECCKPLARPTSQCILFDGENISFDASLVIYINSTNISSIMIINRVYETQNRLSL